MKEPQNTEMLVAENVFCNRGNVSEMIRDECLFAIKVIDE